MGALYFGFAHGGGVLVVAVGVIVGALVFSDLIARVAIRKRIELVNDGGGRTSISWRGFPKPIEISVPRTAVKVELVRGIRSGHAMLAVFGEDVCPVSKSIQLPALNRLAASLPPDLQPHRKQHRER